MVQQAEMGAAVPTTAERVRDLRREVADPQVVEKARRRRFSASYKLKILEEVDRHPERSGAILRREGLYSSHLSAWRKQRDEGALKALDKKRGPKGKSAEQVQIDKLERDKARLQRELFKANAIIDAQKKLPTSTPGWVPSPRARDADSDYPDRFGSSAVLGAVEQLCGMHR